MRTKCDQPLFAQMIVADLAGKRYYQKCHDPDCRRVDYRSTPEPFASALVGGSGEDAKPLQSVDSGVGDTLAHAMELELEVASCLATVAFDVKHNPQVWS